MEKTLEFKYFIKKLGKDTITYIPAKFIPGLMTIIALALFTRIFGPDDYGDYILVITTTTILSAVFSQWVIQSILRYRAQHSTNVFVFNKNLFKILLFISVLVIFIYSIFYPFKSILGKYEKFYIISLLIILAEIWFSNILTVFQADTEAKIFSLGTILNAILKLLLPLVIIMAIKKDIYGLLWGNFFSTLIIMVIFSRLLFTQQISSLNKEEADRFLPFLKKFFLYGFPMIGWFLGTEILMIADRYFLKIYYGSREVGIYSTNFSLVSSAITFISMPLLNASHPLIMKANANDVWKLDDVQKLISSFSRYFLILVFPIITYLVVLREELVKIFLGAEYRYGNSIFPVVALGLFMWFFAMFGHKGLELREKTHKMFIYILICTLTKIALNIFLIPSYGYLGAGITTLICLSMYPILVYFGTLQDIRWDIPWLTFLKIVLSSFIFAGIIYLIKQFISSAITLLLVSAFVMIAVFLLLLFLFKEIQPFELEMLINFVSKKSKTARAISKLV